MTLGDPSQEMMQGLAREFEEVQRLFDEHVSFNDECLPHVLMADIARLCEAEIKTGRLDELSLTRRLVDRLERYWETEPHDGDTVSNVIAVSFLEGFRGLAKLRPFLGPRMSEFTELLGPSPALVQRDDVTWPPKNV